MVLTAALFDMDGTVLNTVGDLCDAMNTTFERTGHARRFSEEEAKILFGSGVKVAIVRALALESGVPASELEQVGTAHDTISPTIDKAEVERLLAIYKPYYAAHCDIKTKLYPGILELLARLKEAGVTCAVISNKPDEAVQTLTEDLFGGCFDLAVGERAGIPRKPAPDMLLAAMDELGVEPSQAIYIGDSEIDLETAAAAKLPCITVTWGFRSEEFLRAHSATMLAHTASEVADFILAS